MSRTLLPSFNPDMMSPATLEGIFVQREALAAEIVEAIRESILTQAKHYRLLVGPRGIGKTHLVALLYHRVKAMDDLRDRVVVAWTREEEWGVASMLDLFVRILRALAAEEGGQPFAEALSRVRALSGDPDAAEQAAGEALREACGERVLLLLMENLDDVFGGLGRTGQERLRAYLQNNPFCTIVATSQSLFNAVSRQTSPFYGFFAVNHLAGLTVEEATGLLLQIAQLQGDDELAAFIQDPVGRARLRAIHLLAGGNHRIYVILSQFLNRQSLDQLVDAFLQTLDELTPSYQARMAHLSPQQRKLVDFVCANGGAVPVKGIAEGCFVSHQTTSSQLKQLREMGYVQADALGRESYYELREPLMRLWSEVKRNRAEPIRLLVHFLRVWYTPRELREQLGSLALDATLERVYLTRALEGLDDGGEHPLVAAASQSLDRYWSGKDWQGALRAAEELVAVRGDGSDLADMGAALCMLDRHDEAMAAMANAVHLTPDDGRIWEMRGLVCGASGRHSDALCAFRRAQRLARDDPTSVAPSGVVWELVSLGRWNDHLRALDRMLSRETGRTIDAAYGMVWALLRNCADRRAWRRYLGHWVERYAAHEATTTLGGGLVRAIPFVLWRPIDQAAAQAWRDVWHEVGGDLPELQLPLRLLDAAVEWKANQDPRILLRLPAEERKILKPLLGLETDREG